MNPNIDEHKIDSLREFYQVSDAARKVLDWAANRTNDAAETTLDRIIQRTAISRGEAVEFGRRINDIGCGLFVVGRRGGKSRIQWTYSLKSMGEAAKGQADALVEMDPEIAQDAVDQQQASGEVEVDIPPEGEVALNIPEAKRRLALTFGITPEAIEITIRA